MNERRLSLELHPGSTPGTSIEETEMSLLWYPHEFLRKTALPLTLEEIQSEEFRTKISKMFAIMYWRNGVGLAATQVGWDARVLIGNPDGRPNHDSSAFVLINPSFLSTTSNAIVMEEGCLSFPGIYAPVERHDRIHVKTINVHGEEDDFEVDGFLSRIIQHEYDHLDGVLFIDKLTKEDRKSIKSALSTQVDFTTEHRKEQAERKKKKKKKEGK